MLRKILKKTLSESFAVRSSANDAIQDSKELEASNLRLLGRLPQWSRLGSGYKLSKVARMNRHLRWNSKRISKFIDQGKYEAATLVWLVMLRYSFSYQLSLFHRTMDDWCWKWEKQTALKVLQDVINKCRAFNMEIVINRFYILKKSGKWRPIGAPNLEGRVIARALSDLTYTIMESKIPAWQHGFRKGKGANSAILDIFSKIMTLRPENAFVYEFDFSGFFNKVVWGPVWMSIRQRSKLLAYLLTKVLSNIRYRFNIDQGIKEETELQTDGTYVVFEGRDGGTRQKLLMYRRGLPQGLAISPILSSLALAETSPPKGLVMYADDGLIIGKKSKKPKSFEWFEELTSVGAFLEENKSGWVDDKNGLQFTFVGVKFNFKDNELVYQGATFRFDPTRPLVDILVDLIWWLRGRKVVYSDQMPASSEKDWHWFIKEHSFAHYSWEKYCPETAFLRLKTFIMGWLFDESVRGYRFFYGDPIKGTSWGIYDVLSLSSNCIALIEAEKRNLKFKRTKRLNLSKEDIAWYFEGNLNEKKDYVENWDGNSRMFLEDISMYSRKGIEELNSKFEE